MKKKDKKLNKKAAKKAKKAKKNAKFNAIDTVKNAVETVKNINKDTIVDFAKKNAKVLIAIGSTVAVLGAARIAKKAKKRK